MRNIFSIFEQLTKEEKRYFKLYLNRLENSNKASKMIDFVDLLTEQKGINTEEQLQFALYPTGNKNTYYQLKNRLLHDLEKNLVLFNVEKNSRVQLLFQLCVAKMYITKTLYAEAYHILKKIERQATKEEEYDILLVIYHEICDTALHYADIKLKSYLLKQKDTINKYGEWLQIDQVLKLVNHNLYHSNYNTSTAEIRETLLDIQQKLEIKTALMRSPKTQFAIHNCIRRILLQKKDFSALAAYLKESLHQFEEQGLYTQAFHGYKIIALVWLINTLFKTYQFDKTLAYIQALNKALLKFNKLHYNTYFWTYYQCLYLNYFYTNQCQEGIKALAHLVDKKQDEGTPYYDVFLQINLFILHYCLVQKEQANQFLLKVLQKEVFNKQPKEVQLRLSIVEIILHMEEEDWVFLDYKLTETRRTYRKLLNMPAHHQEKEFLKLVKKITNAPDTFQNKKVQQYIHRYIEQTPAFEPGSNEILSYRLWLSAQLQDKPYYQVLLETIEAAKKINNLAV